MDYQSVQRLPAWLLLLFYTRFIKRVTGHREPWGGFVDVKINAPDLLRVEIKTKKWGRVWVSSVCDPYQLLEAQYRLTRQS